MNELRFIVLKPQWDAPATFILREENSIINRIDQTGILNRLCAETGGSRVFREMNMSNHTKEARETYLASVLFDAPQDVFGTKMLTSVFDGLWDLIEF